MAAGATTGKYINQGGIQGRTESTGLGVYHVLNTLVNNESFCEKYKINTGMRGKKIIIQGFGNVGYHFAKFSHKAGAKIVGIIERDGAIYSSQGFDPDQVKMHITTSKNITTFSGAEIAEAVHTDKIWY
jgi:glutamate dehydrogenase (NAD(P)+)